MDKIVKKYFIFAIIPVLVLCFLFPGVSSATGNVFGWAWSQNIGWMSLNKDGFGSTTGGGGSFDYGVNIGADGKLSGYAWSENIGWINFAPAGTYPETPNHSACINLPGLESNCDGAGATDFTVTGWVRACSVFTNLNTCSGALNPNRGGWDGWIKLHNVVIDTVANQDGAFEFHNWAWGSNDTLTDAINQAVVGWTSFNCTEGGNCATNNYKVTTSFPFNHPPIPLPPPGQEGNPIGMIEPVGINYCDFGAGAGNINLAWQFTDADGDAETRFQFQVDDNSDFSSREVDYDTGATLSKPNLSLNSQAVTVSIAPIAGNISFNKTYYWRVKVYDVHGTDSGWVIFGRFTTTPHAWPSPNFTYLPALPLINHIIDFTDISRCYNLDNTYQSCRTTNGITYGWSFDDGSTGISEDISHIYTSIGTHPVTLGACDVSLKTSKDTGCCYEVNNLSVKKPIGAPEWKEISPF